jgi:hypothetical protein
MEIWKEIIEGYEVSNEGVINGIRKKDIGSVKQDGYKLVWLKGIGFKYVHRIVWEAFNGTIPRDKEINHKNGNKADNRLDNLELTSKSENIKHSYMVLGRESPSGEDHWSYGKVASEETRLKMRKKKLGENHPAFKGWYVINGVEYASTYEAEKATGINRSTLRRRCLANKEGYDFKPIEK